MTDSAPAVAEPRQSKSGPWWEIALVMALYLGISLAVPSLKELVALPLVAYMVIESWRRHRTWAENGFSFRTIPAGFARTWGWILIVVFVAQTVWVLAEKYLFPEVYAHVIGRVSLDISSLNVSLLITLAIATFLEEVIFRAFFQNRLTAFVSPPRGRNRHRIPRLCRRALRGRVPAGPSRSTWSRCSLTASSTGSFTSALRTSSSLGSRTSSPTCLPSS